MTHDNKKEDEFKIDSRAFPTGCTSICFLINNFLEWLSEELAKTFSATLAQILVSPSIYYDTFVISKS